MISNKEFVARVIGGLKLLTKDGHISRRYVLSAGKVFANTLLSQKLDEMTLFREEGIISTLRCFEMEQVENIECCIVEFRHCKSIMKSVNKLPELIFGKNGSSLVAVMTIDGSEVYDPQTPREAKNRKTRRYVRDNKKFYSISDGHLYTTGDETELLDMMVITPNLWELDEKSSCCKEENKCKSYWDYEFVCPDRLLQTVIDKTIGELANVYRTSIEDTNPNLDENSKGKTQA